MNSIFNELNVVNDYEYQLLNNSSKNMDIKNKTVNENNKYSTTRSNQTKDNLENLSNIIKIDPMDSEFAYNNTNLNKKSRIRIRDMKCPEVQN
jgi:hypothetical protein